MNTPQRLWWEQTESDFDIYCMLRRQGVSACHQLHYLQMTCEEIAKAYFWRNGNPSPKKHLGFLDFLKALNDRSRSDKEQIAQILGFANRAGFEAWIKPIFGLAHALKNLAPSIAGDGPNAEYPWPHSEPVAAPLSYDFPVWSELTRTGRGRQLMRVIESAVRHFPQVA